MNKPRPLKIRISISLLLSFAAPAIFADDVEDLRVRFVSDSLTDRQPASTSFPNYPSIARRDRIEGDATVCFKIDARGRVKSAGVTEYSHKIFRRPALRAARASSFEPLAPGQVLAKAKACRTYRFRLEPVEKDEPR